jgi:segregation and condensation protein A
VSGATDLAPERTSGDPEAPAWEGPSRTAPTNAAPILTVAGFEGPLDWLLEMARAQKIDLARLSIAALIGAFAAALDAALARRDGAPAPALGRWGEWLVMAATLAWLRSRLLLPADAPAARAAGREAEALRRQLLGRAHMAAAADWLERRERVGGDVFGRGTPAFRGQAQGGNLTELLRACLVVLHVPEHEAAAARLRAPPLWTISAATDRVRQLLAMLPDGSELQAFLPEIAVEEPGRDVRCRAALASTLVAGLELARTGDLGLEQAKAWRPIHLRRSPGDSTAPAA